MEEICKFVIEAIAREKSNEIRKEEHAFIDFLSERSLQLFSNINSHVFKNYRYLIDKFISKIREKINS